MSKAAVSGLYAITPEIADTVLLVAKVEAAVRGGARAVQYRSKGFDAGLRREQAIRLAVLCRNAGVHFIVNDDAVLAEEVEADGVHLGAEDASVESARALLGEGKLVGVSCYNQMSIAASAASGGADYIAFGSFFPSPTKPAAVKVSTDILRAARRELRVPIVAIGGITVDNGAGLIAAGADALAVISALFEVADVEAEARRFASLFSAINQS